MRTVKNRVVKSKDTRSFLSPIPHVDCFDKMKIPTKVLHTRQQANKMITPPPLTLSQYIYRIESDPFLPWTETDMFENLPPTQYQSSINADQQNSFALLGQPKLLIEAGALLPRTWYIKDTAYFKNTTIRPENICHCPVWMLDGKCYVLGVPKKVVVHFGKTISPPFTVYCIADASLEELDKLSLPAFNDMLHSERARPICTSKDYYYGPYILLDTEMTLTRHRSFWRDEYFLGDSMVMKCFGLWQRPRRMLKYFRGIWFEIEVLTDKIALPDLIALIVLSNYERIA